MSEGLVTRLELSRFPFRSRPVAEPGRTVVLQMATGELIEPRHPYTTGETFWRGPKAAYLVDMTGHAAWFDCELPSRADAVFFTARITYSWCVYDAVRIVSTRVEDPEAVCRGFLEGWMPTVTGKFAPKEPANAGRAMVGHVARAPANLDCGLRIHNLNAQLRMDVDQASILKELETRELQQLLDERNARGRGVIAGIEQENDLTLTQQRQGFYADAVAGGRSQIMAVVLAQDPAKAQEILSTMIGLSERQEERALQAVKALIDGDQIRIGELDEAVQAAVRRISGMLGGSTGTPPELPPKDMRQISSADEDGRA